MNLPSAPTAIDAEWMNENMPASFLSGRTVTDVAHDNIGEGTGIFGEIGRVSITFDDGTTDSVIAKMACHEPANLAIAQALGIYERELNMFEHVMPRSGLTVPSAYVAERGEGGTFLIVMEDLSHSWDVGDQVVGATLAQAEAIVDALAAFHAQWWQHPDLDTFDWLPRPDAHRPFGIALNQPGGSRLLAARAAGALALRVAARRFRRGTGCRRRRPRKGLAWSGRRP